MTIKIGKVHSSKVRLVKDRRSDYKDWDGLFGGGVRVGCKDRERVRSVDLQGTGGPKKRTIYTDEGRRPKSATEGKSSSYEPDETRLSPPKPFEKKKKKISL